MAPRAPKNITSLEGSDPLPEMNLSEGSVDPDPAADPARFSFSTRPSGEMVASVLYASADEYSRLAAFDHSSMLARAGWKVKHVSQSSVAVVPRCPWPQKLEWILTR